jgi:hypothetical protein
LWYAGQCSGKGVPALKDPAERISAYSPTPERLSTAIFGNLWQSLASFQSKKLDMTRLSAIDFLPNFLAHSNDRKFTRGFKVGKMEAGRSDKKLINSASGRLV